MPSDGPYDDFLEHIAGLPRDAPPNVFGMNTNASIAKEHNETAKLFSAVLLTQVTRSTAGTISCSPLFSSHG